MSRLIDLHRAYGQSAWLDNLDRTAIDSGELKQWIDRGVRGITSNPTIFANSMANSSVYDVELYNCFDRGLSPAESYWELVVTDIKAACDQLAPLHRESASIDGFVSVEVSPRLASSVDQTVEAARTLVARIDKKNVMIKIPATDEGIEAFRQLTADGVSVNVTLIFSLDRYRQVLDAYTDGLSEAGLKGRSVRSVASFFIRRIDDAVDQKLAGLDSAEANGLVGKAAIAQAHVAYGLFEEHFSGDKWRDLVTKGCSIQRLLWASTGVKDPDVSQTKYIDGLIANNTVNTMPPATVEAFEESGTLTAAMGTDRHQGQHTLDELRRLGISLSEVGEELEVQGLRAFSDDYDKALELLQSKASM